MNKIYTLCLCIGLFVLSAASDTGRFSKSKEAFVAELGTFLQQSNHPATATAFARFQTAFQKGTFQDVQIDQIRERCDWMRNAQWRAHPHFTTYLNALSHIPTDQEKLFDQWHQSLEQLAAAGHRQKKVHQRFLDFSYDFFKDNVLFSNNSGLSWKVAEAEYNIESKTEGPQIVFDHLELIGIWKQDTLLISGTSGSFDFHNKHWQGQNGQIQWWQSDMEEVNSRLVAYEMDLRKSRFTVKEAQLHFASYFGQEALDGQLEISLRELGKADKSSYPRFRSEAKNVWIPQIGEGLEFRGGVKLWGSKIYGFGDASQKARICRRTADGQVRFVAQAKHFVIEPGKKISGEQVSIAIHPFATDSICHPSVNLKYDIADQKLALSRGKRGSDRNPFFDSYHQVNIASDKITWDLASNRLQVNPKNEHIGNGQPKIKLTSTGYFDIQQYRRLQNIANYHPVASLRGLSKKMDSKSIDALAYARLLNPRFDISSVQSLLYELVAGGFITYDKDQEIIHLQPKVFHSTDAAANKIDYDNIRIISDSKQTNAEMLPDELDMLTHDVRVLEFSDRQKVALRPHGQQIRLQRNRNMAFAGRLYAGFGLFDGKDFHFDYDRFHIQMDSIRYFDLFVPSGKTDAKGHPEAFSIGSRIEHLSGTLLIDAPGNKSGKEDIEMFPAFVSKEPAYVYYDSPVVKDSSYSRDSFYFELEPFSVEHLDQLTSADLKFKGRLASGGIFPDIREPLQLQEDQSLGFATDTPQEGLASYGGKGTFEGTVRLNNEGLRGSGKLQYLWAEIESEDFTFRPTQMLTAAQQFHLSESKADGIEVPKVEGQAVDIDWQPLVDSMYIQAREGAFQLFDQPGYSVSDLLILTPGGLKAKGTFNWAHGTVKGPLMSIGTFSVFSDTCDLQVKVKGLDHLALNTENVYTRLDFDKLMGTVAANEDTTSTTLPYNQYRTNLNKYDWDMHNETITFRSRDGKKGLFQSLLKEQEGLQFEGETAFYRLKTNELKLGGVDFIQSADARIYPDSGLVDVLPGGVIPVLENASIKAGPDGHQHHIRNAKVRIKGRYDYEASGWYEYVVGDHQQSFQLNRILGNYHGKGRRNKQSLYSWGKGSVDKKDGFYVDQKLRFYGDIELRTDRPALQFDGYAQLELSSLSDAHWFALSCQGNPQGLSLYCPQPQDEQQRSLQTGLYLRRDFRGLYTRILQPLDAPNDRPFFEAAGTILYEEEKDQLLIGDSLKISGDSPAGNRFLLKDGDKKIQLSGLFHLGSNMAPFVETKTAGWSQAGLDGTEKLRIQCASGWDIRLPDKLAKIINSDIQSVLFEARLLDYNQETHFYKQAMAEFIPEEEARRQCLQNMTAMGLELPSKYNPYTFLFSNLLLEWNNEYQSFLSCRPKVGLASIQGKAVNRWLEAKMEVKMPPQGGDRLYLYLKSPNDYYYFFSYRDGLLSTISNNEMYNAAVEKLGKKERLRKVKGGELYEIQLADGSVVSAFLNRHKSGAQ